MITFEPDSPWEVGQIVVLRDGDKLCRKVVVSVEHSDDGHTTQYNLANVTEPRQPCLTYTHPWVIDD